MSAPKDTAAPAIAPAKTGNVAGATGEPCEEFGAGPCSMVIFGASGDLARRKLMPSLYRLFRHKLLPDGFFVIGSSRTKYSDDTFRKEIYSALRSEAGFDELEWIEFAKKIFYSPVVYGDPASYSGLKKLLIEKDRAFSANGSCIFYLATPPSAYPEIVSSMGAYGLNDALKGWRRLVVEKPYGRDLESARDLSSIIYKNFSEESVYRIDHYLGKDTVQNIMMLRFANSIFEPIWNRRYVDHIQITVAETIGVEKRAGYYEQSGIVRDMFQNHMLQVLSIVAMEPPSIFESDLVSDERVKVMRALRPLSGADIKDSLVAGQYAGGESNGGVVKAYIEEDGVAPDSRTATFAALKVYIDNWRWQGVPIYMRSGKRMKSKFSQVKIQFRGIPHRMFRETIKTEIGPNALILRIQPDERVQLKFHTKSPGSRMCLRDVVMDFPYLEGYKGLALDAYERVLLDCMSGDKMLFVRSDGLELSWAFLAPAIEALEAKNDAAPDVHLYRAGTWGPAEADGFINRDGRRWGNYTGA
ncbi:MAG: glucose-6-phosphate dehydrogenase [Deltaproteobacteria bacterium]|nr:glucose-6-phosphate dehydrogenase [Deltaproteobacteria bacterium]